MASSLPDRPSLDRLRRDARRLQRAVEAGDDHAVQLVGRHHPAGARVLAEPAAFRLHDAQLTVARAHGFSGWPALVHYVEIAAPLTRVPGDVPDAGLDPAGRFAALACLRYDGSDSPDRWANAAGLLAADPTLVEESVWAAAAALDPVALAGHLAGDPALATASGGPFDWPPLLYLAYSRVPVERTAEEVGEAVRLLLAAGADPDTGYLWAGLSTPFTALTGAFGGGEQGIRRQPPHPHSTLLATLLLDAGADPVDGQALYNRMFTREDDHLRLLFAHGLGDRTGGPWSRRLGEALEAPAQMFDRQVRWAAEHGFTERLALLAERGIAADGVPVRTWSVPADPDALVDGRTLLHDAAWEGELDRVEALLAAGADPGIRDLTYGTTPLGWAEHAFQTEVAERLRPLTTD